MEEIKQNTNDWHNLRNTGIGASESPIILGLSKYKTALQLYYDKINPKPGERKDPGFVQEKGHRLEVVARSKYEFLTSIEYPDKLGVHADYPFIRASFDGLSSEGDHIEIKFVGAKQFIAINDVKTFREFYEAYYCQMQHQSLITGKDGTLVMINDKMDIKSLLIPIDLEYIADMIPKLNHFWECVQNKTPPEIKPELDKKKITLLCKYKKLKMKIDDMENKLSEIRTELLENLENKNYECDDGKLIYVERKGNVDYGAIKELKNIDLEKYRKNTSFSWMIK